jgi:hypothetical protein
VPAQIVRGAGEQPFAFARGEAAPGHHGHFLAGLELPEHGSMVRAASGSPLGCGDVAGAAWRGRWPGAGNRSRCLTRWGVRMRWRPGSLASGARSRRPSASARAKLSSPTRWLECFGRRQHGGQASGGTGDELLGGQALERPEARRCRALPTRLNTCSARRAGAPVACSAPVRAGRHRHAAGHELHPEPGSILPALFVLSRLKITVKSSAYGVARCDSLLTVISSDRPDAHGGMARTEHPSKAAQPGCPRPGSGNHSVYPPDHAQFPKA